MNRTYMVQSGWPRGPCSERKSHWYKLVNMKTNHLTPTYLNWCRWLRGTTSKKLQVDHFVLNLIEAISMFLYIDVNENPFFLTSIMFLPLRTHTYNGEWICWSKTLYTMLKFSIPLGDVPQSICLWCTMLTCNVWATNL